MAKKSFDVKQFLLHKGERVGLGVAVGVAALLLLMGLLGGLSAKSPDKEISAAANGLKAKLINPAPPPDGTFPKYEPKVWVPGVPVAKFEMPPWYDPAVVGDIKKRNPPILPVDFAYVGKTATMAAQMDFVRGLVPVFEFDVKARKIWMLRPDNTAEPKPLTEMLPARMVVVTGTFPLTAQLEVFRRALRLESVDKLFEQAETTPRLRGVHVERLELRPDG